MVHKEGMMNTYVTLYRFTEQGVRTIKDAPKRIEKIRQIFKENGAEVKQFFALMGQYDTMIIAEAKDDDLMAKLNILVDSMGNVTSQTMRAFNEAEFKKLIEEVQPLLSKAA